MNYTGKDGGKQPNHTKKGPGRYHPAPDWLTAQRKAHRARLKALRREQGK